MKEAVQCVPINLIAERMVDEIVNEQLETKLTPDQRIFLAMRGCVFRCGQILQMKSELLPTVKYFVNPRCERHGHDHGLPQMEFVGNLENIVRPVAESSS